MLTDLQIQKIKFTGKIKLHADVDGLYLRVSATKKRWQLSFMNNGKLMHFYATKEYPEMSLRQAREWAEDTRKKVIAAKGRMTSQFSLYHYIQKFRKDQVQNGRAEATLKKIDMRAEKYLSPHYNKDIREFTPQDILDILTPIGDLGFFEARNQVRELLSAVFLRGLIMGVITNNPVDNLHKVLPTPGSKNRAAVTEIYAYGELLLKLEDNESQAPIQTRISLQLLSLLFVRPENIRFMEWKEIDFEEKVWRIPAEKMKGKEFPLDVPLCTQALEKLHTMFKITGNYRYVFSMATEQYLDRGQKKKINRADAPYCEVVLRNELIRLGYYGAHMAPENLPKKPKFHSAHGFRASARTIMDEVLEFAIHVIEQQLGHVVKDTNGTAYNRTKHWDKRVLMMQLWADFCDILKTGNTRKIQAFIKEKKGAI